MPQLRRATKTELNLDGLTDSVTNLVGALILLVVLLIAVTSKTVQRDPAPTSSNASGAAGKREIAELLQQFVVIQSHIDSANGQISGIQQQVAEFRGQVSALVQTGEMRGE